MPKTTRIEKPPRRKPGPKPKAERLQVTTVRLNLEQWEWLKRKAFARALVDRTKPDASAIMRELVDHAMKRKG